MPVLRSKDRKDRERKNDKNGPLRSVTFFDGKCDTFRGPFFPTYKREAPLF